MKFKENCGKKLTNKLKTGKKKLLKESKLAFQNIAKSISSGSLSTRDELAQSESPKEKSKVSKVKDFVAQSETSALITSCDASGVKGKKKKKFKNKSLSEDVQVDTSVELGTTQSMDNVSLPTSDKLEKTRIVPNSMPIENEVKVDIVKTNIEISTESNVANIKCKKRKYESQQNSAEKNDVDNHVDSVDEILPMSVDGEPNISSHDAISKHNGNGAVSKFHEFKNVDYDIQRQRRQLPIFRAKEEILQAVRKDDCLILIAETACGKTTQVPQYLYHAGFLPKGKMIGVTQPRRVAAITIAERVALEMGSPLGGKVGYSVRFDDTSSKFTRIKYVTDGTLLRESINDPLLTNYSVIVLDEAHERTVHTDILFGIVKAAQSQRKEKGEPLKIIIMSATLDCDHFSKYFNGAPAYTIQGRQYDITVLNVMVKHEDYVLAALATVFQIHRNEEKGDILVFATGQEEIDYMVKEINKGLLLLPEEIRNLSPYPLYAALPSSSQLAALKPAPHGTRKVIISTNIAETSLTIPGIKYVVDTGKVKAKTFNPLIGLDILKVQRISREQAEQRTGRAGREKIGFCYRLYTVEEYNEFKSRTIPEIQRCNLGTVILQVTALGIKNIRNFDFLDKPDEGNISAAIQQLKLLEAMDEDQLELKLTKYGQTMVHFPLDPRFSKIILMSRQMRCTNEILSIIALMSVESLFLIPSKKKEEAMQARKKFSSGEGDHIMLLNMYKWFKKIRGNKANKMQWCFDNFVNYKTMQKVLDIRHQLSVLCQRLDILPCSCQDTMTIRKCLITGLFMNAAELQKDKTYKTVESNKIVHIHPSSAIFGSQHSYVIYTDLVETTKCYMRNLSVVHALALKEVAPEYFKTKRYIGMRTINHDRQ